MIKKTFDYSEEQLKQIAMQVINIASKHGATACELDVSEAVGLSVSVRMDELENIEYNQDKGIDITVYIGQQKGHASTSDFTDNALVDTVKAALDIARFTSADNCSGLADKSSLANEFRDLDLFSPWQASVDKMTELARCCENSAMDVDARIVNSEGANISSQKNHFIYVNSNDFCHGFSSSRQSISVAVVAEQAEAMQRDYWYSSARHFEDLLSAQDVGKMAGERSVRRLGARKISTGNYPVLFESSISASLIACLVSALSGGNLYRKSSFLLDSLGQQILPEWFNLYEQPHLLRGMSSSYFDAEGVKTKDRQIIDSGVVNGYFLASYSARKLGMQSTANAGGAHNLIAQGGVEQSFAELVRKMDKGLIVSEMMGQGINLLTGDYSRGASGFWVENGQIVYPVEEITIAGNLKQMFQQIIGLGNDFLPNRSVHVGSILIESMTVAGDE